MDKRRRIVVVAAALPILAAAALLLLRDPPVSSGENGSFEADCCGSLVLTDGTMLLNGQQSVRYRVARDRAGPYLLPRIYVGVVQDQGLEVDGTRPPVKLRLDRLPGPTRVVLYEGLTPYPFTLQRRRAASKG